MLCLTHGTAPVVTLTRFNGIVKSKHRDHVDVCRLLSPPQKLLDASYRVMLRHTKLRLRELQLSQTNFASAGTVNLVSSSYPVSV